MTAVIPPSCVVETPSALANAIVDAVGRAEAQWLDPCVGEGVFIRAIREAHMEPVVDCCDITKQTIHGARFLEGDFLDPNTPLGTYDIVVANPPYVPVFRLTENLRVNATSVTGFDLTVSSGSSYWLPFLIKCLRCLKPGGNLGFVLPAAYEYGDYCRAAREGIPKLFRDFEVHRSLRPMFPTVSDGCIVILGFGFGETHHSEGRFEHANLEALLTHLAGACAKKSKGALKQRKSCNVLGEVVELGIGAVTGDSSYFLMSERQRLARGIPAEDCVKVFTRAKQVARGVLIGVEEWGDDERSLLFKPSAVGGLSAESLRFLKEGEEGGCNLDAQKIRLREAWWDVPTPARIDGVVTGMFSETPWIAPVSRNVSCTNTLYWYRFRNPLSAPAKRAFMLSLYTSSFQKAVLASARRYPDGLLKLEPGQFKRLPLIQLDETKATLKTLRRAAKLLRNGDLVACRQLADSCI